MRILARSIIFAFCGCKCCGAKRRVAQDSCASKAALGRSTTAFRSVLGSGRCETERGEVSHGPEATSTKIANGGRT